MNIPLKQAIVEVANTSEDRDILYSYVANENDHTVEWGDFPSVLGSLNDCLQFVLKHTLKYGRSPNKGPCEATARD